MLPNILNPPPSSSDPPEREPGSPRIIADFDGKQHEVSSSTPVWTERLGMCDACCARVGEIMVVIETCLAGVVLA
jgi:hypothetical protein